MRSAAASGSAVEAPAFTNTLEPGEPPIPTDARAALVARSTVADTV